MDITETVYGNDDWIHLTHGSVQWRALLSTVMNLSVT